MNKLFSRFRSKKNRPSQSIPSDGINPIAVPKKFTLKKFMRLSLREKTFFIKKLSLLSLRHRGKKNPSLQNIHFDRIGAIAGSQKLPRQAFMHLSLREQILFIKQLTILIRAGVPMFSSLKMLRDKSRSKTMKKILNQVIKDVENGQYLAASLGKFKKIFGELTINIISVGEISGTLSSNLAHLEISLKKKQNLFRKIIAASVYPIFIVIATILTTVALVIFVFPKIIPVFKSLNYDLPWTTKFLIFLSDLLQNHGLLICAIIIILIVITLLLLKIKKIRFWFDWLLLSIPFISKIIQMYNVANICRTVGLLLNSGVTVVRTFQITSNCTTNSIYKKELNNIADKLIKGEVISMQVEKNPKLFPPIMAQMLAVGESTGKLSDMFLYLSEIYEEEMDEITKNLSTTVEPILLGFMGILVGFIAISIITPIYGITQHLSPK